MLAIDSNKLTNSFCSFLIGFKKAVHAAFFPALSFAGLRPQGSIQWIPRSRMGAPDAAQSLWSVGLSLAVESTLP